jgi:hypothetical protein
LTQPLPAKEFAQWWRQAERGLVPVAVT